MIVSPTPTTLSSVTVAAQVSTRLLFRRTGSERGLLDEKSSAKLPAKSSVVEGPSPASSRGSCTLRCFQNDDGLGLMGFANKTNYFYVKSVQNQIPQMKVFFRYKTKKSMQHQNPPNQSILKCQNQCSI